MDWACQVQIFKIKVKLVFSKKAWWGALKSFKADPNMLAEPLENILMHLRLRYSGLEWWVNLT